MRIGLVLGLSSIGHAKAVGQQRGLYRSRVGRYARAGRQPRPTAYVLRAGLRGLRDRVESFRATASMGRRGKRPLARWLAMPRTSSGMASTHAHRPISTTAGDKWLTAPTAVNPSTLPRLWMHSTCPTAGNSGARPALAGLSAASRALLIFAWPWAAICSIGSPSFAAMLRTGRPLTVTAIYMTLRVTTMTWQIVMLTRKKRTGWRNDDQRLANRTKRHGRNVGGID